MNFGMIDRLVDGHIDDIQRQARRLRAGDRGRGPRPASGPPTGPATGPALRARLRSRIGFALVEVGLHLQATAGRRRSDGRVRLNESSYW
jgi:hypothetical protein